MPFRWCLRRTRKTLGMRSRSRMSDRRVPTSAPDDLEIRPCLRLLFEPPAEAVLHTLRERAAARLGRSAAFGLPGALLALAAGMSQGGEREQRTEEHDQEAEQTDHRDAAGLQRQDDSQHQKCDTQDEQRDALKASTSGWTTQARTAHRGCELGILGVERTLNLVEQSLLVLGEWHSFLLRHSGRERRALTVMAAGPGGRPTPGASPSRIRAARLRDYPIRNHGRVHRENPAACECATSPLEPVQVG